MVESDLIIHAIKWLQYLEEVLMRYVRLVLIAGVMMLGVCSKESCLKKYGYSSCEHLRKALNLQDKDEAIKYNMITKECGCEDSE